MPQSRPTEHRERPTDVRDPNRNAYSVPEAPDSPACSRHFCVHWVVQGLDAPDPSDRDGDGVPDFVETRAAGRRTRPLGRERQARLARAAQRRSPGRPQRQDRRLPLPDRRRTVRLRGAGPRPGDEAAPDPAAAARLPRPRQRLQRLRVPGDEAARRPAGDLRPRVQPHPPVRLRRLPGPLVRRGERDLDRGPGLQRHQRLPPLRPPLGEALGNAADRPARSRSTAAPSGTSGWRAATGRRSSARPGPGRSTPGRAASRSAATSGRCAPAAPPTSATTSPASPPPSPSGGPARASARAGSIPDVPRQGRLPLDGAAADATAQPHHLRRCCGCGRGRAAPSSSISSAPRGTAAGVALVGRVGSERHGHPWSRLAYSRGGGDADRAPASTRAASSGSPRWSSTPTPAPAASTSATSTGAT